MSTHTVLNFASTFTIDEVPSLVADRWAEVDVECTCAGFNQVFQSILNASSLFYVDPNTTLPSPTSDPNRKALAINIALIRLSDLRDTAVTKDNFGNDVASTNAGEELARACRAYQKAEKAKGVLLLVLCPEDRRKNSKSAASSSVPSRGVIGQWVTALKTGLKDCSKVVLVDDLVRDETSVFTSDPEEYFDSVSDKLGAIPYTKKGYDLLAYYTARALTDICRPPTKVIVCDCDNTLWAGQVGDSENAPFEVKANLALMKLLKKRKDDGDILLITASKNSEIDVKKAFDFHSKGSGKMTDTSTKNPPAAEPWPLSFDDFVLHKINWEPKSQNILAAAEQLNLTVDLSWVFLDDNPMELAEVGANPATANVTAIQVPAFRNVEADVEQQNNISLQAGEVLLPGAARTTNNSSKIMVPELLKQRDKQAQQFADHLWPLDDFRGNTRGDGAGGTTTAGTASKSDQYRVEFARQEQQKSATSFTDFINSLDLKIRVEAVKPENEPRVLQLTQKSNQFNFTTKRHLTMPSDLNCSVVFVSDRFGDYGLVGVLFWSVEKNRLVLDNFVMSCRVLGRGVEHKMLKHLVDGAAANKNITEVKIQFQNSGKNLPAQKFLRSLGLITPTDVDSLEAVESTWSGVFDRDRILQVAVFDPENVNTYGASVNEPTSPGKKTSAASARTSSGSSRPSTFAAVDVPAMIRKSVELATSSAAGGSGAQEEAELQPIDRDALAAGVTDALISILGELSVDNISVTEILTGPNAHTRSLTTLGMDSFLAVRCLGEVARTVKKRFDVKIDLVSKVDKYQRNPRIEIWLDLLLQAIADSRASQSGEEEVVGGVVSKFPYAMPPTDATGKPIPIKRSSLDSEGVMFQVQKGTKSDTMAPMVFVHPAGGATRPFHKIWKALGIERDLWAIEHPFMTNIDYDPRTMSLAEIGALYSDAIIEKLELAGAKKGRKWVLSTYSAGGVYMNETYHQLRMKNQCPSLVLGLDWIQKPMPHCPLYCPAQPCYFPQIPCGCCYQCFGLQELCKTANCLCVMPCMTCINNGRNHDKVPIEKLPQSYNTKYTGYMMPKFLAHGPLLESAYDFFRMGFENTKVIEDRAPVQQTMKMNKQAKTWDQKVEAVKIRLDEKLQEDGMDEDQRKMITTKWERSANVFIQQTAPNLMCCMFTPVSYGNTPFADFEVGRQGPGGCCANRPMRGWDTLNQGGMAYNVVGYGNHTVNAVTSKVFKEVFPADPPHMKAHQLVLLDPEWVEWVMPKIAKVFEDLKLDEPNAVSPSQVSVYSNGVDAK
ncbi:unnamed protein product [Amoebophrya sp. A120]|nr:unnamed protein product [Amoebophrya sp. A120]|eukprot:GSA120T00023772001.1